MSWSLKHPNKPELFRFFQIVWWPGDGVKFYGGAKYRKVGCSVKDEERCWNPEVDAELAAAVEWLGASFKMNLSEQALLGTFLRQQAISLNAIEGFFAEKLKGGTK